MGLSNSLAQSEYDQLSMIFRRILIDPPDNFLCNRIKDMPHLLNPRLNILFGYVLVFMVQCSFDGMVINAIRLSQCCKGTA